MTPALPQLLAELELDVLEVAEDEEFTVFRIVTTDNRESPAFVDSFRSHADLGLPPRKKSPEITHPAIYHGISAYDRRDRAVATAIKVPQLGEYVAGVRLDRVAGATYYFWGPPGHLTVWGDAVKLADAAVDVLSVEDGSTSALHDPGQRGQRRRFA